MKTCEKFIIGSSFVTNHRYEIEPYVWEIIEADNIAHAKILAQEKWGDQAWAIEWDTYAEQREQMFTDKYMKKTNGSKNKN